MKIQWSILIYFLILIILGEEVNVDNDFKRELVFYEQAKSSILSALDDLKNAGIPTVRPDDYYAEMAKKDDHMKMVCKLSQFSLYCF